MRKDICPCPNCAPYAKPKKAKKAPKEYTIKSAFLKAIERTLNFAKKLMWFFAAALMLATVIGGLFYDVTASDVASWFSLTLVISVGVFFLTTFILFIAYFLKRMIVPLVFAIVGVTLLAWICIAPDGAFVVEVGNTLSDLFSFVNKPLF